MNRLSRWIRRKAEQWLGNFYEGPEPPDRIGQRVVAFMALYPNATKGEWAAFATRIGMNCYREGWVRGFEWGERDLGRTPEAALARAQEHEQHDFVWHAPEQPTREELLQKIDASPGDLLSQLPTEEAKARYLAMLGRYHGGYRVVVVPSNDGRKAES